MVQAVALECRVPVVHASSALVRQDCLVAGGSHSCHTLCSCHAPRYTVVKSSKGKCSGRAGCQISNLNASSALH